MKFLLTQPVSSLVKDHPRIPDLAFGYLGGALKRAGISYEVRDWNMDPSPHAFKAALSQERFGAVGVKVFTKDVSAAQKTIAMVKKTLPQAKVIVGGPHVSCVGPEELFLDFPDMDFAIAGEAERALPMLLSALKSRSEDAFDKIPGLIYRNGGAITANPPDLNADLDSLGAPLWDDINPTHGYATGILGSTLREGFAAPIITTRGCPGKCTFCSAEKVNGAKVRYRSPESILDELKLLKERYGVRKVMIQDNCFTSDKERLVDICQLIIKSKLDIEWDCVSYENLKSLTDDTIGLMARAGCKMMHIGIESASYNTRSLLRKKSAMDEIDSLMRLLRAHGVGVGAWFMLGFPEEKRDGMNETIEYAMRLKAERVFFNLCFPLPGTHAYEYLKQRHGIDRIDWASFDLEHSQYPMSELGTAELLRTFKTLRFKLKVRANVDRAASMLGIRRAAA